MRPTHIDINQSALRQNLDTIKRHAPHAKVMAMVKSNAYGHEVAHCVPYLMQADAFGVASFEEALLVREICQAHQQPKDIVIMAGVFDQSQWQQSIERGFGCVVHCQKQLDLALYLRPKSPNATQTIWLKYNTGMNRLGFDKDAVLNACQALIDAGYQIVLTSHFACADDKDSPMNDRQMTNFLAVLNELKQRHGKCIQGSLCNSAGIINFPCAHYDWVRAGIALYGGSPVLHQSAGELGLKPVMHFYAQIFATHHLNAGECVGYGGLWQADKPSRIGVISAGYGDGYPRVVSGAKVLIIKDNQSYFAPVIGRVSMDMMMIDLTDTPAMVGDTVVLWGDGLLADTVARWANTISYELFCKTSRRPLRQVI